MTLIIVGVTLFAMAVIIANILQSYFVYRYESHPILFIALFLTCLWLVSLFVIEFTPPLLNLHVAIIAFLYITTTILLTRFWQPMQSLYGSHTVPVGYEGLIKPKFSGQVVKVFEIALQDTSAWLIVGGLFLLQLSLIEIVVIFTTIVTILHVPGLWVFGKVYGWYFLIMSTALAFLVLFFYTFGSLGFLFLYSLHLGGYVFMYIMLGHLGMNRMRSK